ncbi:MAG: activase, partial [Candidatus Saccharibacteria bacterium]
MKTLGLCTGASNIGYVLVEKTADGIKVLQTDSMPHEGNPRETIRKLISLDLLGSIDRFAVTGRRLRTTLNASSISEPEAIEYAYQYEKAQTGDANIIVSAGGETFMVYELEHNGKIIDVYTGNKCASGTGEFFLQQLKRMNLT